MGPCAAICGGVGGDTAGILEEAGKDVGKFMGKVVGYYIAELVKIKLGECVDEVVESLNPTEEEDEFEEKKLEDKNNDIPIIAAGVILSGQKHAIGPDTLWHLYYDFAGYCIRTQDSVIGRITYRHDQLKSFSNEFAKSIQGLPQITFPQEKDVSDKNREFYKKRYDQMVQYYKGMNQVTTACHNEKWLMYYKLVFDPQSTERREVFLAMLQNVCTSESIDWERAANTAKNIGIDLDECEMLKYVAVQKIFGVYRDKLKHEITSKTPSQIPVSIINKAIQAAEESLIGIICKGVETAWKAGEETFKQIHSTLSTVLDKAKDPVKEIVLSITTPVGDILKEKFSGLKEKVEVDDKLSSMSAIKMTRFTNIAKSLKELKGTEKSVEKVCTDLMSSISDLNYTHKYVGYLRYNMGNKKMMSVFSKITDITEQHSRLCIAMLDVIYVLGRGLCRAFVPLCKYVDEASNTFDKDKHDEHVRKAVAHGAEKLAKDFFEIPNTIWRACWYCGSVSTENVTEFARVTVSREADLLGSIAANWKPTSKEDARETFTSTVEVELQKFISERTTHIVTVIRESTVDLIAELFDRLFGEGIYKITKAIDELLQKLPDPLCKLETTKLIKFVLKKMISAAITFAVREWARPTEMNLCGTSEEEELQEEDEDACARLRVAPRIRNDDDKEDDPFGEDNKTETKTEEKTNE